MHYNTVLITTTLIACESISDNMRKNKLLMQPWLPVTSFILNTGHALLTTQKWISQVTNHTVGKWGRSKLAKWWKSHIRSHVT